MHKRWLVLAVLAFARIAMGFQFQAVASVSPFLVEEFGIDYASIGTLIGLYLLPGVVLAICCPDWQVDCVDAVAKKAAFVQQVAVSLRLPNLRGRHARVEQLTDRYPLVTSRAFASLVDFTQWSAQALADGGAWAAMKGRYPADEIAQLASPVHVFHVEPLAVPGLDAERCLVWLQRG